MCLCQKTGLNGNSKGTKNDGSIMNILQRLVLKQTSNQIPSVLQVISSVTSYLFGENVAKEMGLDEPHQLVMNRNENACLNTGSANEVATNFQNEFSQTRMKLFG